MTVSSTSQMLEPDLRQALRFLTLLSEPDFDWTFQTFDDNAERADRSLAQIFHSCEGHVAPKLIELNRRGAGVFVMINRGDGKGRKAENVIAVRAVFVDLDGAPMGVLESAPLKPHIVVETSPGRFHAYWRIEGLLLEQFVASQLALARRFNGDLAVKDLSRVMRLPGYYHLKHAPFRTRIVSEEPLQPYQAAAFLEKFGIDPTRQEHARPITGNGKKVQKGGRNSYLASLAGSMRRRGMGPSAIEAALQVENEQSCEPPLDPDEVARVTQSIGRYSPSNSSVVKALAHDIQIRCLADVTPAPIEWLWPNRIALGKVTLIAGDPGLGKSLLTLTLASHVSRGKPWPVDDATCPCADVLLLSAEDDVADTIRPRLDAAGADPRRVRVLEAVFDISANGDRVRRLPNLARDIERLDEVLSRGTYGLVIVDPVSAYLGGVDTHQNAHLRAVLAPLAELATHYKVAIVCVSHLTKGSGTSALYRTTGSIAFVAAARAAYVVTRDKEDETRRLVLPIKNNLAEDQTGLAYRVKAKNGVAYLAWEDKPVTISADEALAPPEPNDERSLRDQARAFLQGALEDGPVPTKDVFSWAAQAGFSSRTVQRAKDDIGVIAEKTGFKGGWQWTLPPKMAKSAEAGHVSQMNTFGTLGTLPRAAQDDKQSEKPESVLQRVSCLACSHWNQGCRQGFTVPDPGEPRHCESFARRNPPTYSV